MSKVIIAGGGPAGMMAAIAAAKQGHEVSLYEQNEKLGKKLFITGKGRCNVTNACDPEEMLQHVVTNRRFLYSSIYGFSNYDLMDFMEASGCPVKVERGGRVFPVSDKSSDVIRAMENKLKELGVKVHLNEAVEGLLAVGGICIGIRLKRGRREINADAVIVATGGVSYPATGSTGDGHRFAKALGHEVTGLLPALVAFEVKEGIAARLQGLSLKNIRVKIRNGSRLCYEEFGEMLFTHFGVSGPVILSASSFVVKELGKQPLSLSIDLKPALSPEQLDARLLREFQASANKQFKNSLGPLFPSLMVPVMVELSGIDPDKKVHDITRAERLRLGERIKDLRLTLTNPRSFQEAIITQGGVAVKEVDPGTMESKRICGLYFAGEVLDLDAVTGGYNLQIAWSTGYTAGNSVPGAGLSHDR